MRRPSRRLSSSVVELPVPRPAKSTNERRASEAAGHAVVRPGRPRGSRPAQPETSVVELPVPRPANSTMDGERLEAPRVAGHEPRPRAPGVRPARARLSDGARVVTPAVDDHEGVSGVRVDRHVAAAAAYAVAHEAGGVQWGGQQAGSVQRVGDRAGAVVARVAEGAVAAAIAVVGPRDSVCRTDQALEPAAATATACRRRRDRAA